MAIDIPNLTNWTDNDLQQMIDDCEMQRDICESFVVRGQQEQKRRRKLARQQKLEGLPAVVAKEARKLH